MKIKVRDFKGGRYSDSGKERIHRGRGGTILCLRETPNQLPSSILLIRDHMRSGFLSSRRSRTNQMGTIVVNVSGLHQAGR